MGFWTIVGSANLVRFNVAQYIFYDIAGKFKRRLSLRGYPAVGVGRQGKMRVVVVS